MIERHVYVADGRGNLQPTQVRIGFVERFFPRADRTYGFARMDDGAKVFFHMRQARCTSVFVRRGSWNVRFHPDPFAVWIPYPARGERIIILFGFGTKKSGPFVAMWARLDDYESASQLCVLLDRSELVRPT